MLCWKKNKKLQTSSHSFNPSLPWRARIARNTRIGRMPTTIHTNVDKKNSAIHANDNKWHYSNNSCPVRHKLLDNCTKKIRGAKKEQIRRDIYLGKQRGRGERASTRPSSQSSPEGLLTSPRLRRKAFENFNSLGNKFRMRGVVATKGNQSASEHPAAVHGALLTPATIPHTTKAQNSPTPTEHHKLHLSSSHFTSGDPPFPSSHRI